jgi:NAD(P)-dependent dehydrogenase (short-subunit alcohol dehydrogenase family)
MEPRPVAVVTGAAARLGRAIALRLAREGYAIASHYNSSDAAAASLAEEIRRGGGVASLHRADFALPGAADQLAAEILRLHPAVRLLVNNASVWKKQPIEQLDQPEIEASLRVNLVAPMLLSAALGRAMRSHGGGAIVNLLDWSIKRPYADYIPYTIAKAGLAAATRGLARALAPEVRVNALAPGPILLREGATEEERAAVIRSVPMGRIGTPEEVAQAVVYLAGATFVTGTILSIDGGRSLR